MTKAVTTDVTTKLIENYTLANYTVANYTSRELHQS